MGGEAPSDWNRGGLTRRVVNIMSKWNTIGQIYRRCQANAPPQLVLYRPGRPHSISPIYYIARTLSTGESRPISLPSAAHPLPALASVWPPPPLVLSSPRLYLNYGIPLTYHLPHPPLLVSISDRYTRYHDLGFKTPHSRSFSRSPPPSLYRSYSIHIPHSPLVN
jgi:hypothetical protein